MAFLAWYWWLLSAHLIFCLIDNTLLFQRPPALDKKRRQWPKVSVLIPARNEEARIRPCLETLLKQGHPSVEILVLDDRSTDGTFNLVKGLAKNNSRLKVLRGKELPAGWRGKTWACHQLAQKAKGEWLFFTDADTWHHPDMLQRTLQMAEEKKGDLVTLFTCQVTKSWMETLVIPVMAFTLLAFLPARLSLRKNSFFNRFAGVSGQFLFIHKKAYRKMGGHGSVRHEIVEDLNFGRRAVESGLTLIYGDGSDLSFCRMYTNALEVWEGFSKNFFAAVHYNYFYFLNSQAVLLLDGVAPFLALLLGPQHLLFYPALTFSLVSLLVRGVEAVRYRFHLGSVFLHPVGCLLFSLIGFNSLLWRLTGRGHWKGRSLKAV